MAALSITKLRVGAEAYQLSGVAQSLDAYYTGNGEAPGTWVGAGSEILGLTGEVEPDDLRAALAGIAPKSGGLSPNGKTPATHARRVPGFDLTFKIPKSVSVLYAVSDDPRVQGAITDAGNKAIDEVMQWLEREAIRVRRGSNNQPWLNTQQTLGINTRGMEQLKTSGLVAASFRHRTSRAGDPFLHWHVLAANMAQGTDGKWSAFVHPEIYRHARAAGEVFQAVVRDELTASLGLEWRPGKHVHEIAGVPDSVMRVFSKRRAEIEAWTEATGTPADAAGNQAAALATRRSKGEQETTIGLRDRWQTEATEAGWGPGYAEELIAACRPHATVDYKAGVWRLPDIWFDENGTPQHTERVVDAEEWIEDLLRKDLTNDKSVFTKPDVTQAIAQRLGDGATLNTIERVTEGVMASPQVLFVERQSHTATGVAGFTSRGLYDTESRFVNSLKQSAAGHGPNSWLVDQVLDERPTIGDDQTAAVRTLVASTTAVSVMVGPAGTGKTFTLDAVREVFERDGWDLIGAAPSARAARELQSGAHIGSSTMHSLLARHQQGIVDFGYETLLVIDEAGMADIRILENLINAVASSGGRVALVGDHKQLPEVGAGGGFAYAAANGPTVAELTVNRRQKEPWEQQALTNLRDGDIHTAIDTYMDHGRVVVAPDSLTMTQIAVNAWFKAQEDGTDLVLQAGTNELVDILNRQILERLAEPGGPLHGQEPVRFAGGDYRIGERVVIRRNYNNRYPAVRVTNGQAGTILNVQPRSLTLQLDDQPKPVTLDQGYVNTGGRLSHAYAYTTHRTQGGTWDASIAVGLDGLYREGAYTALSRGRDENTIIITDPEHQLLEAERAVDPPRHDTGLRLPTEEPGSIRDELTKRLTQCRGKLFATAQDWDLSAVDAAIRRYDYPELRSMTATAQQIERVATTMIGNTDIELAEQLTVLDHTVRHIRPGVRVRANDRSNIGTVTSVNDQAGTAIIRFESTDRRIAERRMGWEELTITDKQPLQRQLGPSATAWFEARFDQTEHDQARWTQIVTDLGSGPHRARVYDRAANQVLAQTTHQLTAEAPIWLDQLVGLRPSTPEGVTTWDSAVTDVAGYRLRNNLSHNTTGLGPRPQDVPEQSDWDRVNQHVGNTRVWLLNHPDHAQPQWPILPSLQALIERGQDLQTILATAPPDQQGTIAKLLGGQLSLADTQQLLEEAMSTQSDRQAWIIEHWPHVVEASENGRNLAEGVFGPDTDLLSDIICSTTDNLTLLAAAFNREPWLLAALNEVADPTDADMTGETMSWLEDVADYRKDNDVIHRDPFGGDMPGIDQARSQQLIQAMDSLGAEPDCFVEHESVNRLEGSHNGAELGRS